MQNMTKYDQQGTVGQSMTQYDPVRPCWKYQIVVQFQISVVFVTVGQTENCKLVTKAKLR